MKGEIKLKVKKAALSIALIGGILISGIAPNNTYAAEPTKAQLQKQVKALKEQIESKNATIRQLKSQLNNSYVLKTVDSQLSYKGYLSPKKVTIGNSTVPSLLDYNGIYYTPVQTLSSMLSLPYSKDSKTVYIGVKPEGQYMMDIKSLHPFNNTAYKVNTNMTLAGETYNKGIQLNVGFGNTYSINLGGKYTNIQGLVGVEPYDWADWAKILITDENDNVLYESTLYDTDLPKNFDIDVTGVNNLKIKTEGSIGSVIVDLVNITIK